MVWYFLFCNVFFPLTLGIIYANIYTDLPCTPLFKYNNNHTYFINFILTFRL